MLALILLVVLGGGVGLLVVSLAESSKPATDGGEAERVPDPLAEVAEEVQGAMTEPAHTEVLPTAPQTAVAPAAAAATAPVAAPRPRRVRDARNVPRSHTAIEGRFDEVATAPAWRRVLSLIAVVAIAVALGVGVAAVAGAVIGAVAELLDAAVIG